jgi:hypothetical protein
MNTSKAEKLNLLANEIYEEFIKNETYCGLNSIFRIKCIGSKTAQKIRSILYDIYGKDVINSISRHRTAKNAHKNRSLESYYISEDRRQKMIDGVNRYWKNNELAKSKSRESMIKYCLPHSQSEASKLKRKESRRGYHHSQTTINKIRLSLKDKPLSESHKLKLRKKKSKTRINFTHSDETKSKLSEITKQQWINGVHKPIYKSKGHSEIIDIITNAGYTVKDEYIINGKPYDVYVFEKNLIIEFNGTYWHRDPRFYNDKESSKIWEKDQLKIETAIQKGYRAETIWQFDWERCDNKKQFIEDILNDKHKRK